MEEILLNDDEFLKLFFQFPNNFPVPKNEIYYIHCETIIREEIQYVAKYKNIYITDSNCLNNKKNQIEKFRCPTNVTTVYVYIEEPLINIIENNYENFDGKFTDNRPLITNKELFDELREKYKFIITFLHCEGIIYDETAPHIFERKMLFNSLFTGFMSPYFDFDFDMFNFSEDKYDNSIGYTTIYICWN